MLMAVCEARGGRALSWALAALLWAYWAAAEGGLRTGTGAGTPGAGTPEPATPESESPQPGSPQSGTLEPGSPQPGTPQSGTLEPGSPQPGTPQPGSPESETPQPGSPESETLQPGSPQPGTPQTGSPESETLQPGTPEPGTLEPGDPTPKILTSAVPICTCDLMGGACELKCCCDPDCSSADVDAFSSCLPGSVPVISQVCIEESVIFTSNGPFRTIINKDGLDTLFCVIVNNPKTNYFVTPQSISRERFPSLVSQFGRGSFSVPSVQQGSCRVLTLSREVYQVGDPIMTLFRHPFMVGVLRQPTALTGGECTDRNPAGYLQDHSSRCTRSVGDLNATCHMLPALNAESYFNNFDLSSVPNITIQERVKIIPENGEDAYSPFVRDNKCMNVVSEVTYRIKWKGAEGIVGASVNFVVIDVPLSTTKIQQTFHTFFVRGPANGTAKRRSGNPGYLRGKPILAFNGEAAASLTVLKSTGDGSCSQLDRSPVLFQHQMRSGCFYRFSPGLTCSKLQTHINLLLLGNNPPDSLGILGNASSRNLESLTRIINLMPEALNVTCETSCNLSNMLEMQILWAMLGPLANPQAALLGARFQYQRQDVQCSTGRVSLKTSVTFIETTRYPPAPRDQPTAEQKLPFDFFYPFKVISSGVGVSAGSRMGTFCSVLLTGFLNQR
ncbi:tectonic-3-like isoform X1 [Carcharodon carcharias]|uniref:tectonic-3-like isoform X1 n=1 Tax=Carcharodon carcharias TaxID=13397 RepID=UPI001B7DD278|nr:tectonic-3-like isoform X1 [Carcharodon carcharias]